jgi:uroporphyrinogen decarboxylase
MDGGEGGLRMNPRERLLTTLDHREPDRVPLTTRLWLDTRIKLRKHFGVETDEGVYQKLGVEPGRVNVSVGPPDGWEPSKELLGFCEATGYDAPGQHTTYEEWGIRRELGSKGTGRLLQQFYFTRHPWGDFKEVSDVEEAILPDLDEPGRFDQAIEAVRENRDSTVVFGDLGHCQWTKAWELRGMTTFMKDLHVYPRMAEAILDKLNDYYVDLADRLLDLGAEGLRFSEDWGNNKSMFINPKMWRKVFKPRYNKLFHRAKRRGGFVLFHSDGNITPLVGDLVKIGIDILNPVQPECMDQVEIKRQYGDKITLDTGISVQRTLPFGTIEEVKNEAKTALKELAPGGGFVYGTSHYAMYDVPVENIVALYETCEKYGEYPIRIP